MGTIDIATGRPETTAPPAGLVATALGALSFERQGQGGAPFAIEQLCTALLADEPRLGHAFVDRLLDCGVSVEAFYETYIPGTAARFGEMWGDDTLSFTAVTLGMSRLTETFRRLSPIYLRARVERPKPLRALFALCPGETHALGIVMAADCFERAGWSVRVELRAGKAELARVVATRRFDLVGLSAAARIMIPTLGETVALLRTAAPPGTPIVIGGHIAALDPDVAAKVGADQAHAVAQGAMEAVEHVL